MRNYKMLWVLLFLLFIPLASHALEYKLRMSKNDELCGYVDKTYNIESRNEGVKSYEKVSFPSKIKWNEMPRSKSFLYSEYSYLDINNDGAIDLVVRMNSTRSNTDITFISIHKKDGININEGYTIDNYKNSKGKIALSTLSYPLQYFTEKPAKGSIESKIHNRYLMSFIDVKPFIFSSTVFVAIHDYMNTSRKKWLLIAKYNGGAIVGRYKDSDKNVLSDICYFEIIN